MESSAKIVWRTRCSMKTIFDIELKKSTCMFPHLWSTDLPAFYSHCSRFQGVKCCVDCILFLWVQWRLLDGYCGVRVGSLFYLKDLFYSARGGCPAENDALFTWKLNNLSRNFNSLAKSCVTTSAMMYTGQIFEAIVSMLTRVAANAETCFVALFTRCVLRYVLRYVFSNFLNRLVRVLPEYLHHIKRCLGCLSLLWSVLCFLMDRQHLYNRCSALCACESSFYFDNNRKLFLRIESTTLINSP